MKLFRMAFLAAFVVSPVAAQHDEHATVAPATEPVPATSSELSDAPPSADAHAEHEVSTMSAAPEPAIGDPHAGHVMPATETAAPADPMAGHDMNSMNANAAPTEDAPPPPEAFSGPAHAADTIFDPLTMTQAREVVHAEHGDIRTYRIMADQLETRLRDDENAYLWDAQGWYGGDINKVWFKTEGEGNAGESPEQIEAQLLWSHAVRPFFDFQAGIRQDFRTEADRSYLVLGVQGLVPYKFELDTAAFLSEQGDLSARIEAEYDQWLTQRLLLQPRLEVDLAAQDVPELGIGTGLGSAELGLRLRYQFAREFAPYIGVEYERRFGDTADFSRLAGKETGGWNFVMGVRAWF